MASTISFPQSGDADDAEHFAGMIGISNITDYVESGGTFSVDYTVPEVTIADATSLFNIGSQTTSSSSETVRETGAVIQVQSATKSLTDSDVNHIYIEPDIGTDDNGQFTVYTNTSNAPSSALKIGEIDTTNDTKTLTNREPVISAATPLTVVDADDDSVSVLTVSDSGLDLHNNNLSNVGTVDIQLGELTNVTASGEGHQNGFDADTVDGADVYVQDTTPSDGNVSSGDIWVDTSS